MFYFKCDKTLNAIFVFISSVLIISITELIAVHPRNTIKYENMEFIMHKRNGKFITEN